MVRSPSVCSIGYMEYDRDGRVRRMCEALASDGCSVHVISLFSSSARSHSTMAGVTVHTIDMRRHRGTKHGYLGSYARFAARAALLLGRLHSHHRFDVVHVNTMPDFMVFAAAIPKAFGGAVLLDFHDMMPELYADKFGTHHRTAIAALRLIERTSARFADHVLAVHDLHRERLIANRIPGDKISTILNVPDERIFRPLDREPAGQTLFQLIYHGTITSRHGVDLAVRAFARAHAMRPFLRFRIIGDGDGADDVATAIRDERLEGVVEFMRGFVPVHELPALLSHASAGIISVRRSEATDLMLPVKMLEYARLGIPVISARTPTITHYFGEDAISYVDPLDLDSTARAIVTLADDPTKCAQLRERAREVVESISWSKQKTSYLGLVRRLADA